MANHKVTIDVALTGQQQAVGGLDAIIQKAREAGKISVSKMYDAQGNVAGAQIKQAMSGIGDAADKAKKPTNDFVNALRRAVIVAPIWMVARASIQQVTTFLTEGIQHFLETEKAILNVKSAIQDMGGVGSTEISRLVENFHNLSLETGKTEASISNVFAEMVRTLGNTSAAWEATSAAVKLGEATFTDAAKIAETLGMLYKANGESLNQAATETQRFKDLQVMLYEAQAKTPGGIERLNASLLSGIPIMTSTNISIEDFIKLNSAMASSGITSGMALKTGLTKIITNLGDVTQQMGLSFSKNTPTMEVFMAVLNRLGTAMKTGQQGNIGEIIKDVFGGVRGGQIAAMAKDINSLNKSMATPLVNANSIFLYEKQMKEVQDSVPHQLELFANLKKQAGDTFVTAVLGGRDFADAMKNANEMIDGSVIKLQALGVVFNTAFKVAKGPIVGVIDSMTEEEKKRTKSSEDRYDLETRILMALKGQLSVDQLSKLTGEIEVANSGRNNEQKRELIKILTDIGAKESAVSIEKQKQLAISNQQVALGKVQEKQLEDLILQYAKANPSERAKIGRQIELTQMSPESQVSAFQSGLSGDRKLLLDMMPKLTEDVRNQMTGIIARENGLNVGTRFGQGQPMSLQDQYPGWNVGGNPWASVGAANGKVPGMTTINAKSADTINITLAMAAGTTYEAMIRKAGKDFVDALLNDEDKMNEFAKKLGHKI